MAELIFLTGGARSGKSSQAELIALDRAQRAGLATIACLATGEAMDAEFAARIARHQAERPKGFVTIEEALDLERGLERALACSSIVVLECISTWLGNVYHHHPDNPEAKSGQILDRVLDLVAVQPELCLIVVSNELGMGLVPADALSRQYRDVHGRINRRLAAEASEAWLMVSGLPLRLK